MKNILVDSSVWIDYFKLVDKKSAPLSELIDENRVCMNDLILAELIPSIRHADEEKLVELLYSLVRFPVNVDWKEIIEYQYQNLKSGINKVSLADMIIVQNVIQNGLILFTLDKHFRLMSKSFKFEMYE